MYLKMNDSIINEQRKINNLMINVELIISVNLSFWSLLTLICNVAEKSKPKFMKMMKYEIIACE